MLETIELVLIYSLTGSVLITALFMLFWMFGVAYQIAREIYLGFDRRENSYLLFFYVMFLWVCVLYYLYILAYMFNKLMV